MHSILAMLFTCALVSLAAQEGRDFTNSLGMKFVPVKGTDVLFCIWDTRVQDYREFINETKREWRKLSFEQSDDHPAVMVSWDDAKWSEPNSGATASA